MTNLQMTEIAVGTGQDGRYHRTTFILDFDTQRAWFRDMNGKVRYQEVVDGKCKESVSAAQRKTDKRRKPEVQERITAIWDMLHQPGVTKHNRA